MMAARKLDPVTLEVIRNALPAIANDMANGLARTSYNMMIYEIRDFCTALVNVKGELVSQNVGGVSHFVADLGVIITDGVKRYGADGFEPDDVVIMNHQAVAGQHLNNVVIYMPYFRDGELLMFTMVRAHWVDVGGMSTGFGAGARVTEPWIEGLQFDQLKIYNAGKPNEALIKMIGDNVRFREASLGDMRAQIAACKLAIRRLDELFDKFGGETVLAAIERIFDETEIKCRKVVSTIPDGIYEAESFYDGPEADLSSKVYFHAKVSVDKGSMTIDLSRSAKEQYKYGMNARTMAAARVAYKALTVPLDPVNEGSFRALDVIIPEGSVMMARFPAPMTSWAWLPTVIDTVITALVPAMPDRLPAAHYGLLSLPVVFFGTNPKTGKRFLLQGAEGGGWGGRPHEDGESVSVSICQGDVRNGSLEGMELKNPVVIEERSLRSDSGGAGKFRGGLASDLRVHNLADGMWNLTGDYRNGCPPWGVLKGGTGSTALYLLKKPGENEFTPTRGHRFPVAANSEVIIRTSGGGGWGDPLERDPEMVREDVMEGLASPEAALRDYAVVIDPADFSIDRMATDKLREQRRRNLPAA
jgi:N-methylhydantoinase B